MKAPVILRIFKDNQLVEVKQIDKDQIIFGHDAEVTINLNDESISPIHCLIELRDSGYYLCDLGSSQGTFKKGIQILDEPISSGDNFEIGPFRIQFFVGVPKPKDVPVVDGGKAIPAVPPAPPVKPAAPLAPNVASTVAPPQKQPTPSLAAVVAPNVTQAATSKPQIPSTGQTEVSRPTKNRQGHKSKAGQTFAPPSEVENLRKYLRPTKGPVVEVIVAWQERVLATYHFGGTKNITIGSGSADVVIPSSFVKGAAPFLELKGGCRVLAGPDMQVDLINSNQSEVSLDELLRNGKAVRAGSGNAVRLDQGEIVCVSFENGTLEVFIRYVPNTIRPALGPSLDLAAGEFTGLIVSAVIVLLTALYMSVYTPSVAEEVKEEEQVRLAQFIYNKPPATPTPPPQIEPQPTPVKEKVEVAATPTPPPKVVKIDMEKEQQQKGVKNSQNTVKQTQAAKASEVRPIPSKVNRPKKFTSAIKQGGATKIGSTDSANAQSAKDVNKQGLLSAFGGGGVRKQLDQAYSGAGELLGAANSATGTSGQNSERAGDDIGSRFKDTGAGGKGTATQGISGIGTRGRGSGMSSYGSGVGLGGKGNVTIDAGGEEEGWDGTIDREAVRRVIRSILNQIKSCYERQLRVNSSLEGKVVIQFEIMEQGRVRSAKTKSSTLGDATVESCVAGRIREARFPEPPAGTVAVVDYPFVFGAQK